MPRVHVSGFAALPYALLDQLGDHKNIGWLYLWLYRHGHGSAEGAWASISTLARECHMDPKAVKVALRWLVENGWAQRVSRPGRSSAYFLNLDTPPASRGPHRSTTRGANPPQPRNAPQGANDTQVANTPHHPGGKQPPTTRGANAPHKQEPRNKNPGTRTPLPSSNSLSTFSLSTRGSGPEKKGEEIRSEQPQQPTGQELPAGAQLEANRGHRVDECPERPDHIPAGHPDDPTWAYVLAHPEFPWGGPYAPKPPADPPAVATRLPLPVAQLPAGLQPIADRIEEFWLSKAGSRTPVAFRALVEELQLVLPVAGRNGVLELLRQASQAGWPAINGRAWLSQRSREPDLSNHPAYRVFRAA